MLYDTLYVPTWLIRYFDNLINPNENVKAVSLVRHGQGKELTQAAFEVFCIYL